MNLAEHIVEKAVTKAVLSRLLGEEDVKPVLVVMAVERSRKDPKFRRRLCREIGIRMEEELSDG